MTQRRCENGGAGHSGSREAIVAMQPLCGYAPIMTSQSAIVLIQSDTVIDALLRGRARPYTRPGSVSAIAKRAFAGRVHVGQSGLDGDEQGDPRVHGGPDKALHHYPRDHYAWWAERIGGHPLLREPGAFGENFSSHGLTEAQVCLGDRYRIGDVLLEVSQARQPCWKLNDRFGVADMARQMQASGRTGWYYRVLQTGEITAGEAMTLLERPWPQWTLQRIATLLYTRTLELDELRAALALPLVPSWRRLVETRLARGAVEDWRPRIDGPATG